jgi:hypothetical protein
VPLSVAPAAQESESFLAEGPAGSLRQTGGASWVWTAPKSEGLYTVRVTQRPRIAEGGVERTITLNAFVLHRLDPGAETVGGYRIGRYPERAALKGARTDAYRAPLGVLEVTETNREVRLAPHFTLGQFVCKQGSGWPKFVVLREPLLLKLEALLEAANARGWEAETFTVMSGYRTPAYNRGLGNVSLSRHLYGDAADVFIDRNGDGNMDDLNGDGRVDRADALALHGLFAEAERDASLAPYIGGIGVYDSTPAHGPYVHVDARGFRARWGE